MTDQAKLLPIKKMKYLKLLICIFVLQSLTSCITNKKYILFQNSKVSNSSSDSSGYKLNRPDYKVQTNDILFISVACEDERISRLFSPLPLNIGTASMSAVGNSIMYYNGYTINEAGEIVLPYVGRTKVAGKNLDELRAMLEKEFSKYFKFYHLFLNLSEFRFTVLGEVGRSGKYNIMQGQISLPEAIGFAGDFKEMANKQAIKIIRQYPDGLKVHLVDLTSTNFLQSEFYYLKPNDIVYVEPMRIRTIGNLTSGQNTIGFILPLISTALVVFNTYIILKTYNK